MPDAKQQCARLPALSQRGRRGGWSGAKPLRGLLLAAGLSGMLTGTAVAGPSPLPSLSTSMADLVGKVMPGVVMIRVIGERYQPAELKPGEAAPKPDRQPYSAGGTGVIFDSGRGWIVTNHHVIEGAVLINVVLEDGRTANAKLLATDPATDIAFLEIELRELTALPVGNSDNVRVGDFVVAIGNPFGLEGTATAGIVSGLMRSGIGHDMFESFIQTDAAVNPGNSGGALVNLQGELIAVNTAIAGGNSNIGIGFAIPINMIRRIGEQFRDHGKVTRGFVGLVTRNVSLGDARRLGLDRVRGVLVTEVIPGSPAAQAGLKPDMVIVSVNRAPVKSNSQYIAWIGTAGVGMPLEFEVTDGKAARIVPLTPSDMVYEAAAALLPPELSLLGGLSATAIAPGSPLYGKVQGLVIKSVETDSHAARTGLKAGDVVTAVNDQAVSDLDDVAKLAKGGQIEKVSIEREGLPYFVRSGEHRAPRTD